MRSIDLKHHIEGEQIIKSTNGQPIPDDEPLFLFRGRDNLAVAALQFYQQLCIDNGCTEYQLEGIKTMIDKFKAFAATSPTMKQPGITEGK
jgi:hypothetical protein